MEINPIGTIYTPFKQTLGIPRQPNLAPSIKGKIVLSNEFKRPDCLRDLEGFSHLWLIFDFSKARNWKPVITPPRLKGEKKVGVFATRSPHRPNHLGMSVVKLEKINQDLEIIVSSIDLLDETPILDIKPYLPQWDSIPDANAGWTEEDEKSSLQVQFDLDQKSEDLLNQHKWIEKALIETLSGDLRSNDVDPEKVYKQVFDQFDISWQVIEKIVYVRTISHIQDQ